MPSSLRRQILKRHTDTLLAILIAILTAPFVLLVAAIPHHVAQNPFVESEAATQHLPRGAELVRRHAWHEVSIGARTRPKHA